MEQILERAAREGIEWHLALDMDFAIFVEPTGKLFRQSWSVA